MQYVAFYKYENLCNSTRKMMTRVIHIFARPQAAPLCFLLSERLRSSTGQAAPLHMVSLEKW